VKFLIAGSDNIDRLQSHWLSNTAKSFPLFVWIPHLDLLEEESTKMRRSLVCQVIYSTQLINNHPLADQFQKIVCPEITGQCISFLPGVQ
jgi:hypothetical protein